MNAKGFFWGTLIGLLGLLMPAQGFDDVLITEFMAANNGPVVDEDGDTSDWIEIHNNGTNTVDLFGWFLTDKASQLTQWQFPSTNLAPNAYMLVFASGKNRRVPGAPLHTSFSLKASGEYLALVRPDGTNIATAFSALFPQVDNVSYGIPIQQTVTTLIATGVTARVRVPTNGDLGLSWTAASFDDSSWAALKTGVGYEGAFVSQALADSVAEFSGVQGQSNWLYGYWNRTRDADGLYSDADFVPFPNSGGPYSSSNFWTGSSWDWFNGDPPWTQLTAQGGVPSATDGVVGWEQHWAVRRYVSETDGALSITGQIAHVHGWVYVTATGVAANSVIYIFLTGTGDGYIDDMKLVAGSVPESGPNLLPNGDFESGSLSPWSANSNLSGSTVTTNTPHSGARSLHIVSTAAGSQSAAIKQTISPSLSSGNTYTLSYWYLPGANSSTLRVQTKSLWLDTTPAYCGDGTIAHIFVDGSEVLAQRAFISSSNYSVSVPVHLGSHVDFAIDPGPVDNDNCDNATFTAMIRTAPSPPEAVADSVADWSLNGIQGEKNWFYGYYNQTADTATPGYQTNDFTPFPNGATPFGPNNFWDGASWHWWNGDPPFDEIGQRIMNPNGSNSGDKHWVIRRWRSEVSGQITVDYSIVLPSADGAGVTARVFLNGTQKDSVTLPGTDPNPVNRSIVIAGVQIGDAIDIAVDPLGTSSNTTDTGDRCLLSAIIRGTPSLTPLISSNIEGSMRNVNSTVFLRIPFTISDPSIIQFLTLRMKYDDGFIAYLNGQLVASANAPMLPAWNSGATASHADAAAGLFEEFSLTSARGLLRPGTNVLAIQGLNINSGDADFLVLPELLASQVTLDPSVQRYFTIPTPGAANGAGTTNVGPLISSAAHTPSVPRDSDDLLVTAHVLRTFNPVGSVSLFYRVGYGGEVSVPMFDDGFHGDGAAGDGVFAATIPATASGPGDMVRYYIYATDTRTNSSRFPAYSDPQDSPQYQGTVVLNPALTNPLPVIHMFVQNPILATNYSGTRCSIFYNGEFYDNVSVNLHGQTTPDVFDKRSMNIGMNSGDHFLLSPHSKRVGAFDLITTAADKAYMRQVMAYETFAAAGVPGHFAFPVRLQQNNALYGVMHLIENGDNEFLERIGLDPNGALYKLYRPLTNAYAGVAEKKTRKNEDNADLQAMINGCGLTGGALRTFLYDNIDIPELVNFLAAIQVVDNEDCCDYKNYYLYRDSEGNGEWQMMPYDLDLTFGRVFTDWVYNQQKQRWEGGYYDTNIYWMNKWYSEGRSGYDYIGNANPLADSLWSMPEIFNMFMRRWSTLHEQLLQPANTHPLQLKFERRVDELAAQIGPDAGPDLARWGTFDPTQTLQQASTVLKTNYFPPRRGWIFSTLRYANGGPYLGPQPPNAFLNFGAIEFNPASGNQDQEYVQINNPNSFDLDISGWKLAGAIDYTFRGGVVIPRSSSLYVSPNVKAFRARTTGPRGGQGLFVQGNYNGHLSARGEVLQLLDNTGRLVNTTNFVGAPSLPQQYLRITEIMYHPAAPPPGAALDADEFEFIEVKNTGPVSMSLEGVRFTSGIDFGFTGSAVTTLAPGASALVVRNPAAFNSRYGSAPNIAGQYTGLLENKGENIRLEDASGEKILDFDYDNKWYPITDGAGFSLVIVDENAPWDAWGLKSSWRPSGSSGGSPGQVDPAAATPPAVLITEALTHPNLPGLDQIELFNPTANSVDVNGWYLTDDFLAPAKYRIHGRPLMAPGSYLVFSEADFNANPGTPGNFSLSSKGEQVYLFSANTNGDLTGYYHGFGFGAAESGVSFGRYVTSVGQEQFVAQIATTLGGVNAGPRVGPIVISEIHYHPPDLPDGSDDSGNEFIELQNITGARVNLFDPSIPTNTWRLRGVVDFDFPTNLALEAGSLLLVANFDPSTPAQLAAFRAKYAVPGGVAVIGPYKGKLDNSSGSVKLSKPDAPSGGEVPYILVDEVDYTDSAPWPVLADGAGGSLQRLAASQFGNDPANWIAAAPTAGRAFASDAPPTIVVQPATQSVIASANPVFSVGVLGAAPFRYQWQFYGTNLWGATNATLALGNVLAEDAGPYDVVVFNNAGSTVSSNAFLTVLYGAYFTRQPTNLSVAPGANATFSAVAASSNPLQYQWQLNGTNIPGATSASLTINNAQPSKSGLYQLIVSDLVGSLASLPALLTVLGPPVITAQPQSLTVTNEYPANFAVVATGTAPLSYQWRLNDANLSGAIDSQLSIPNARATNAGNYTVVINNSAGSITSLVATLSVVAPPIITAHPHDLTVTNGGTANFNVTAVGAGPLGYQWRFNGGNLPNAINNTLAISNAQTTNAGGYSVVVNNPVGSVTSLVATLTVLARPAIVTQPQSLTVTNGNTANFSVTATGAAPLNFQWQFNGNNLSNANAATLSLPNAQSSNAGNYSVVITNSAGSITSQVATLTVLVAPAITGQPQSLTVTNGSTASFSVTASGTAPLKFQWRLNGNNLSGTGAATLVVASAQPTNAGNYTVVVNNSAGSVTSAIAILTVLVPPAILLQPTNQAVHLGSNASFVMTASGTEPLVYQWSFGRSAVEVAPIDRATNASFIITNAFPTNAGLYYATVTNFVGSATSLVATLTILDGDADGDGMPDLWEWSHGLDPFHNDAADDPDGDHMSNLQEFLSGTDPHDGNSYLKIDQLTTMAAVRLLSFIAVSNQTYTVQYRNSADTGSWLKLADISSRATNRVVVVADPEIGIDSRFYRLVTPAQP